MRKAIVSMFVTLDGVMEAPEKWSEMLADPDHRLREALADWEAHDDSVVAATRDPDWAAEVEAMIPAARARIRWGLVEEGPRDEDWDKRVENARRVLPRTGDGP